MNREEQLKKYSAENMGNPFEDQKQGAKNVLKGLLTTNVDSIIKGFQNDPAWDKISDKDKEDLVLNAFQEVISQRRKTLKKRYKKI